MRKFIVYDIPDDFKEKLFCFAERFSRFCILESNDWKGSENEMIVALDYADEIFVQKGSFETLKYFSEKKKDWLFGFITYETIPLHFFQPKYIFILKKNKIEIGFLSKVSSEEEARKLFSEILKIELRTINHQP